MSAYARAIAQRITRGQTGQRRPEQRRDMSKSKRIHMRRPAARIQARRAGRRRGM